MKRCGRVPRVTRVAVLVGGTLTIPGPTGLPFRRSGAARKLGGRRVVACIAALCIGAPLAVSVPLAAVTTVTGGSPSSPVDTKLAQRVLNALPVSFEPNVGQADSGVRYLSHVGASTVLLTDSSAVFTTQNTSLAMTLVGANPHPTMAGAGGLRGPPTSFTRRAAPQHRTR